MNFLTEDGQRLLAVALIFLSAPGLSGYFAVVTGAGFLAPASGGTEFLRVMVGLYGPFAGNFLWAT